MPREGTAPSSSRSRGRRSVSAALQARPLQATVATFRSTAGDQTQDIGGASVSDALDVVTDYGDPRTTGYPNTSAELADQRIDYFSQLHFNAAGEVRAPLVVQKATTDLGATPGAEWIQVANATSSTLNISGYALGDEETPDGGEGMYQFPAGRSSRLVATRRSLGSATDYFSVYGEPTPISSSRAPIPRCPT